MEKNNTLYTAKSTMEVFCLENYPEFGKFKATEMTNLSLNPSIKKSRGVCPKWLNPSHNGCRMKYHKKIDRWGNNTVDVVGRGQEFIARPKINKEFERWIVSIFETVDL